MKNLVYSLYLNTWDMRYTGTFGTKTHVPRKKPKWYMYFVKNVPIMYHKKNINIYYIKSYYNDIKRMYHYVPVFVPTGHIWYTGTHTLFRGCVPGTNDPVPKTISKAVPKAIFDFSFAGLYNGLRIVQYFFGGIMRRKTLRFYMKNLDNVFGRYIKARDRYKCITCGKIMTPGSRECQAGHYVSRRCMELRWDEKNVHCQCAACNHFKAGDLITYREQLIALYGEHEVIALEHRRHLTSKYTIKELQALIEYYEGKLQEVGL